MKNRYTFMVSIALALGTTTSVFAAERPWGSKSRDFVLAERDAAETYIALGEEMAELDLSDTAAWSELKKAQGRVSADMEYYGRLSSRGSSDERRVRFSPASTPRTTPTVSRLGSALDLTSGLSPRPASASSSSPAAESFSIVSFRSASPRKLVSSPGRASSHARAGSTSSLLPVLEGVEGGDDNGMLLALAANRESSVPSSHVAKFPLIEENSPKRRSAAALLAPLAGKADREGPFKRISGIPGSRAVIE